jgi:GT2 family glycosyltransferase
MFNYIINIYNSEAHLSYVLQGIKNVKSADSKVYCVIDGCTDRSEEIVDEFGFNKIHTPNVRETKAITTALEQVPKADYYLILQDDVILQDPDTEEHIKEVYRQIPNIGVLGFRHGANLEPDALTNGKHVSELDLIQNEFQPPLDRVPPLSEGNVIERQIVYKSPICISGEVVSKLGGYDSRFEPIAHDDTEYCIRAIQEGYRNYVCALKVMQPKQWGGSRRFSKAHDEINVKCHQEHMNLLRELYPTTIATLGTKLPALPQQIWKNW